MNPVVLHIGTTKTGTSSLQHFFDEERRRLAEAGVRYPSAGRSTGGPRAHHNLFYEISAEQSGNARYDRSRGGWSETLSEIDQPGAAIGLISSEAFQYCSPDDVRRVAELLAGRAVTVVVYLRRHDRWLESAWNQRARFGRVGLSFREFAVGDGRSLGDYARTLRPWIDNFGDHHVDVRIYGGMNRDQGVVSDFVDSYVPALGGSATLGQRPSVNRKAGLKQLLAVATVVRNCRIVLGDQFSLPSQSAMRISSFFRDRDIFEYTACSFDDATEIHQHFAASNEHLAMISTKFRSAGPFETPDPGEFRHHVDLTRLDDGLFDLEERSFVERLTEHVIHHVEETTP